MLYFVLAVKHLTAKTKPYSIPIEYRSGMSWKLYRFHSIPFEVILWFTRPQDNLTSCFEISVGNFKTQFVCYSFTVIAVGYNLQLISNGKPSVFLFSFWRKENFNIVQLAVNKKTTFSAVTIHPECLVYKLSNKSLRLLLDGRTPPQVEFSLL